MQALDPRDRVLDHDNTVKLVQAEEAFRANHLAEAKAAALEHDLAEAIANSDAIGEAYRASLLASPLLRVRANQDVVDAISAALWPYVKGRLDDMWSEAESAVEAALFGEDE